MARRIALVSGSNKGIGFSIVKLLVQRGFNGDVLLTSRDEGRGRQAVKELSEKFNVNVKYHQLDIDDLESIRKLGDFVQTTYGGLDVLVNNAGIAFKRAATDPFDVQAEVTVRTNYFGTRNVCDILYPILRPGARVVHVSSMCGHLSMIPSPELRARFNAKDLTIEQLNALMHEFVAAAKDGTHKEKGWGNSAYNASKVGVSALGFIHQRQFDEDSREDIIVNVVHPGYVDTDMSSHKGPLTPDQGADAATYLAMLPPKDPANPKGAYVWYTREVYPWDAESLPRD
ncbi:carbonyl reductase [NADPH] 1 [Galendromus occidentalis]|uniref:carbonyl reductase (NADPH) n=1 Tax=Galendromus occidentalis TaxID=34638 RepID=A0AAJ6QVC9_9ACAR|nr:carbonyl reductase [NADPH] 1 [Galendromus occidentalis]